MKENSRDSLLSEIATLGYNVGFGSRKHFATYDMVGKIPGTISLIGLLIGVGQLAYPNSNYNIGISTTLIMASIIALTISTYNGDKERYNSVGKELTELFGQLETLYFKVRDSTKDDFSEERNQLNSIRKRYHEISISNQIFGSDWYAHYKFFWQMEKGWVHKSKNLKLWKDGIPLSFLIFIVVLVVVVKGWRIIFVGGN